MISTRDLAVSRLAPRHHLRRGGPVGAVFTFYAADRTKMNLSNCTADPGAPLVTAVLRSTDVHGARDGAVLNRLLITLVMVTPQ